MKSEHSDRVLPADVMDVYIKKINISITPILAATHGRKAVHLVLDIGAQTSLITLMKANQLNLRIYKTQFRATQVDGVTDLKVLGEVHTSFHVSGYDLYFAALVVNKMGDGIQILAGGNFHKENDVVPRMFNDTIIIQGKTVVQCASPTMLEFDKLEVKLKFVSVIRKLSIAPGDGFMVEVPPEFKDEEEIMIEPNLSQCKPFFDSAIIKPSNGKIFIENSSEDVINLKKNCQAVTIRRTKIVSEEKRAPPYQQGVSLIPPNPSEREILAQVKLDTSNFMTAAQKDMFKKSIIEFKEIFYNDLDGYNGVYGKVNHTITFNSRARPPPNKVRIPDYGDHGQVLLAKKFGLMKELGIMIDPLEYGIQPQLHLNAWIVRKSSAAGKSIEKCSVDDVRVVTACDKLNAYLKASSSKAQKSEEIYAALASWRFMSELDFRDVYFQLPFDLENPKEREKVAYLCVRTVFGTLAWARAPQGLLGSDQYLEELTDRLFGDLMLEGHLIKKSDNIYIGHNTQEGHHRIFHEVLKRCHKANLKMKPGKVEVNVVSADILGLTWNGGEQGGKISPSRHKSEPLASCDRPSTIKLLTHTHTHLDCILVKTKFLLLFLLSRI